MAYSKVVQMSRDEFINERGVTMQEDTFYILDEFDEGESCTWIAQVSKKDRTLQVIVRASLTTGRLITTWLGFDEKETEALRNYFKEY